MQLASSWIPRRGGTRFGEQSVNHGALESSEYGVAPEWLPEGLLGNRNGSHEYGWFLIIFVYIKH